MKNLLIPISLLLVILLAYFLFIESNQTTVNQIPFEQEIDPILEKEMSRVIVGLDVPYEIERMLSESEKQKQIAFISKAQDELLKSIPGEYKVNRRLTLIPSIALSVDAEALKFLQESPLVKSITEDVPTHTL